MKKLGFGELELSILSIVRKLNRATVRDVYNILKKESAYTTVMTVMSRLEKKGELARKKRKNQYVYWLKDQNKPPFKNVLKRIKDKIFGGKSVAVVSYLLETDQEISKKDLEEIEMLILKRKSENANHG